jgi:hypothetical protein
MIPHEKDRLEKVLQDMHYEFGPQLQQNRWVLAGSGVLCLHGIDRGRPMGDVDIFCATRLWYDLYVKGLVGLARDGEQPWRVFTTDPDDPKRRVDPPYLYKEMHGIEVNVFCGWRKRATGNIDVGNWIHNAELVEGWPCVPLQFLLDWKEEEGRAKDVTDIAQIKKFLEKR